MSLKPCPFCGAKPLSVQYHDEYDQYYMECSRCSAAVWDEDEDDIVAQWNTRATDARVARLESALRQIEAGSADYFDRESGPGIAPGVQRGLDYCAVVQAIISAALAEGGGKDGGL